jgi:hypothetical protein
VPVQVDDRVSDVMAARPMTPEPSSSDDNRNIWSDAAPAFQQQRRDSTEITE